MQSDKKSEQRSSSRAVFLNFLSFPVRALQPLVPRLVLLLVLLLCVPLLVIVSGAAGWIVWSNVPMGWEVDAFLQYGETPIPFANVMLPPVLADQPYDIWLYLVVPATESNYALGNFMATLRLSTAYNDTIITVRRPVALFPPRSSPVKEALLGAPATTRLEVSLLSQFVSGTSSVNARLELGRSDGWKAIGNGQGRELSVVEATLKGRVRPRGTLALLARYPRLVTFLSTFTFFFISLLAICGVLLIAVRSDTLYLPPQKGGTHPDENGDDSSSRGPRSNGGRYTMQRLDERESTSDASPVDKQLRPQDARNSLPTSSLRKRRSSPALEPVTTTRVKIEDVPMPVRQGMTQPLYPKSPYPRPLSASSEGGDAELVSSSDPETESP